jgi:peptidoglycan-N-acetylglucosamine deacetylase
MRAPEQSEARPANAYSGAMRASIGLHAAAAVGCALRPQVWPWAVGAVVADHLLLTAAGLWPRSGWLGPNWTHLPTAAGGSIALTIDDGPDPHVTPRVLELLARERLPATFFCIGERVQRYPAIARDIVAQGHRIENHSQHHLHRFSLLGPGGIEREICAAQEIIAGVTGTAPRFFRAPAGLRNPFLQPVLARLGLQLVSWTRRGFDTVRGDAAQVMQRLTRRLSGGDILLLHDGHAARTSAGGAVILDVLPQLARRIVADGLTAITLHDALELRVAPRA